MKFEIIRTHYFEKATIGRLFMGGTMLCHTLEPRWLDVAAVGKPVGGCAIPAGTYQVKMQYSPKFRRMMPRLQDVPYFDGILIHPGNSHIDTEGCILVGNWDGRSDDLITHSQQCFSTIRKIMESASEIELTLIDS